MKVDLHVHTLYSRDAWTSPDAAVLWAQRRGLDALAITDHDTIAGAMEMAASSPLPIIVGEEVRTTRGEIIGLFLQEEIPPGLTPEETVVRIRGQGGLVYVPHPLDRTRHTSALSLGTLLQIIEHVDLIEVLNARVTFRLDNDGAARLSQCYDVWAGAGSDAHQGYEIGRAYVEMPGFQDASTFLAALPEARVCGSLSSPLVHVGSTCARLAKSILPSMAVGR